MTKSSEKTAPTKPRKEKKKGRKSSGIRKAKKIKGFITKNQAARTFRLRRQTTRARIRVIGEEFKTGLRFADDALNALQQMGEAYIVQLLKKANINALRQGVATVKKKHLVCY